MQRKILAVLSILALLATFLTAIPVSAEGGDKVSLPIAVDIDPRLKDMPAPKQPSPEEVAAIVASSTTTESQCWGDDSWLLITTSSFDPAHPGTQDVVFWKETPAGSTRKATLWVAWDFLTTDYGREDVITCEQLAYLQGSMDFIVDTNVQYFGDYHQRPAGNENIDVMIYNVVDENYYDPDYPFFVAGFFWSKVNESFDRNMIFVDTLDWENRIGPDALHPYDYEGTVAHELQHLIHNDRDPDEASWVDEGLSDMAEYLNFGGHPASHVVYYLAFHRTSLTVWGGGLESYGASYLFQLYLLENFGEKTGDVWDPNWTRDLVGQPANSIAGIEAQTGASMEDLYDAWILANYLDNPGLMGTGGFPLGYNEIDLTPFVSKAYSPWSIARSINDIYGSDHHGNLPRSRYWGGYVSGTVEYPRGALPYAPLYGTYKGMQPVMNIWLQGDAVSGVAPQSGSGSEVWGGVGNMLTDRILELNTPVGGTLTFWTWYDIEEEWDYGFVEVSTDNGTTWTPLPGSITRTSNNPNLSTAWANSLVRVQASTDAAITGSSDGWIEGTFTLPAASDVLVRFAYYTDESMNGQGWFIDDVSVNGFSDDFDSDYDGWTLGGWTWTTGLFDNDWMAGYVNPVYDKGNFDHLDYAYLDGVISGDNEEITSVVDTSQLNREEATVVISNRPGESPFSGDYLLLVDKGNASE